MKKLILIGMLLSLTVTVSAVQGEGEPVSINLTIEGDKYRFYSGSDTIGFPSFMSEGEPAEYKNASYKEFASWEVSDKGISEIRRNLKRKGSLEGVTTGSTSDAIEINYLAGSYENRGFSYQQLVSQTPSEVRGTVDFQGETVEVTVPVKIRKVSEENTPDTAEAAKADGGFISSQELSYNVSFRSLETLTGNHTGNRIENISTERKHIEFTGYVEAANPCVKLKETYEKKDSKIILNVATESGEGFCTQVLAMKKYRFSINTTEPFRFEVKHDDQSVRNMSTIVSHPGDENVGEPFYGFIFDIRDFLYSIFPG